MSLPLLNPIWWFAEPRRWLLGLALLAVGLSASGFVLEYGFGVIPCPMCWWQRYVHWAIAAVALLAAVKPLRPVVAGAGGVIALLALAGLGVAVWQFSAQHGWLPFPASCTSHGSEALVTGGDLLAAMQQTHVVPCDRETFKLLGLSLAGWNIPSMLLVVGTVVAGLRARGARPAV